MNKNYLLMTIPFVFFVIIISYNPQIILNKSTMAYSQQQNINSSFTSAQQQATTWKTYSNSKFGFSIDYPSEWIIKEKTNRFETGVDLTIQSSNILTPTTSEFTFNGGKPAPSDDISFLTDFGKRQLVDNYFSIDSENRLVEDVNTSKYIIDGEKAGSFTYSSIDKRTNEALVGVEDVTTIHNGNFYIFQYLTNVKYFDNPLNSAIRQHMFNSIKWLK